MSLRILEHLFPVPQLLAMPGGGIEISEHSVKFFRFKGRRTHRSTVFGEFPLPPGTITLGEIRSRAALVEVLRNIRASCGFSFVHASLPEQKGYLFDVALARDSSIPLQESVALTLSQHAPLSPAESVFDCESVASESDAGSRSLVVSVLPEEVALSYADVFVAAGFFPLSFELEPQAAARAILPNTHLPPHEAVLFIDFGSGKSVISVLQSGAVRFTTSADGTAIYDEEILKIAPEGKNVQQMKYEEGLTSGTQTAAIMQKAAAALGASAARVRVYWQSKPESGERREPIRNAIIYGGNANVRGLREYLSALLSIPVAAADLRAMLMHGSTQVPSLHKSESLRYATVIGLALRALQTPW